MFSQNFQTLYFIKIFTIASINNIFIARNLKLFNNYKKTQTIPLNAHTHIHTYLRQF